MTKKEAFINEVIALTGDAPEKVFTPDALDFWNGLQISGDSGRPQFTENGRLVLDYMQKEKETYNNLFKAKEIGEGLGISSRTASGAMRKLVSDGYVEKVGENPVVYSLTTLGTEANLNEEEG
jgi:DNA-binding MarR family transcriptional regulator